MSKNQSKWAALLALFKILLKSTKFLKLALAGASFAAYSYMFTWQFAAMLLIMIFIHELGHVIAMRQCGIHVKGIYLIPFFGGAAVADEDFKTRRDESYIALMGPWFGFLVSVAFGIMYFITDVPVFAAGATWCALINLFNLLPVNPMDGGRVLKSIAFSIGNKFGLIFLGISLFFMMYLIITFKIWLFLILLIVAVLELSIELHLERKRTKLFLDLQNNINLIDFDSLNESERERLSNLKKEIGSEDTSFNEKPKMSIKQLILYSILYVITCLAFFLLMTFAGDLPGCKEALEMLQ